ncbi:hypothetical protein IE53DRAFT_388927 [Violaceomyces palustris]|uniref:Uncharacterized protein n=1 Tax=Violaceomyces palustris TaxID=1673888 RepID=A0ACD0NSQ1_9BASI|nr:hypothetical protein IE53DRAFT_388927 [Violaceomyces palustris]
MWAGSIKLGGGGGRGGGGGGRAPSERVSMEQAMLVHVKSRLPTFLDVDSSLHGVGRLRTHLTWST